MVARFQPIPDEIERTAKAVIDSAYKVHSTLGPKLLESIYEACLCHELSRRGIPFQTQVSLPVTYEELRLEAKLRLDLILGYSATVELKSVEKILPLLESQVLTQLKLTGLRPGLLINFNIPSNKDSIKRIIL